MKIRGKYILCILAVLFLLGSYGMKPFWFLSKEHYNEEFKQSVLEVYDAYIINKTGGTLPVGNAYKKFFAEKACDVDNSCEPDSALLYDWTRRLLGGELWNSYITPIYSLSTRGRPFAGEKIYGEYPSQWSLQPMPDLELLVKKVGRRNKVWKDQYGSYVASGDFSPVHYAMVFHASEQIDFSDRDQRFLVALGFMDSFMRRHPDFAFAKDVPRNDSIRRAWDIIGDSIRKNKHNN